MEKQQVKRINITIEDVAINNNHLWFFSYYYNGLFQMDLINGEIIYLGSVNKYEKNRNRLFASIEYIDNKLYLVPFEAKQLMYFDLREKKFCSIDNVAIQNSAPYFASIIVKDELYLFSVSSGKVLCIDTKKNVVKSIISDDNPNSIYSGAHYYKSPILKDDKIYVYSGRMDGLCIIDIQRYKMITRPLEFELGGIRGTSLGEDGCLYGIGRKLPFTVIKYNFSTDKIDKFIYDRELVNPDYVIGTDYKNDMLSVYCNMISDGDCFIQDKNLDIIGNTLFVKKVGNNICHYNIKDKILILEKKNVANKYELKIQDDSFYDDIHKSNFYIENEEDNLKNFFLEFICSK